MDDPRTERLREIGKLGQQALIKKVHDLRDSWRTTDLLTFLNWDLPDMPGDAAIETVELAQYRHVGIIEAVEALSHFGNIPAPPEWIYRASSMGFVLKPLEFTHQVAIKLAQAIIVEQRQPSLRNAIGKLTALGREFARRRGAGLDPESRLAVHEVLLVSRTGLDRLAQLPAPWAARLRQCPGPRCGGLYVWNESTQPDHRKYCTEACEKALKRR